MINRCSRIIIATVVVALIVPAVAIAQAPAAQGPAPEAREAPAAPAAPAPAPETKAPAEVPKDAAKAAGAKLAPNPVPSGPLAPLAWLNGCWGGTVNQREFREFWHPLRGGMMIGVGHNAMRDKTVSYEHLRLESNADGVFYIAQPSGQKEVPFKLVSTRKDGPDEIFTFNNSANPFPQFIVYRRATEGWLYVEVAGKQAGKDQKVTYPFRRVDCENGEFIRK